MSWPPRLPLDAQSQLATIAEHSQQFQGLDLERARHDAFRPISHAVVTLATLVRGSQAQQPFHHMFCPMVKGGAGDWLQDNDRLLNPYWGSGMLRCGSVVRTIPAQSQPESLPEVQELPAEGGQP